MAVAFKQVQDAIQQRRKMLGYVITFVALLFILKWI